MKEGETWRPCVKLKSASYRLYRLTVVRRDSIRKVWAVASPENTLSAIRATKTHGRLIRLHRGTSTRHDLFLAHPTGVG